MIDQDKAIQTFVANGELYDTFKKRIETLIQDLLKDNNIIPHQITCRVKDKHSLARKLSIKQDKYTSIEDVTDLIGFRVVTYFEDDVDKIGKILVDEFKIDPKHSIDKRVLEADKFGYRSLHYVFSLNEDRLVLPENKKFQNLKGEVQVRSILQHAWAEIEHDIGYKGDVEIPQFAKRSFYRIAALLETADIEFVKLKDSLHQYENAISDEIEKRPEWVTLDKASFTNYIFESKLVASIEKEMSDLTGGYGVDSIGGDFNLFLTRLKYFGIDTIQELENNLNSFRKTIPQFYKIFFGENSEELPKGLSVFYLSYVLAAKDGNRERTKEFCKTVFTNEHRDFDEITDRLLKTFSEAQNAV